VIVKEAMANGRLAAANSPLAGIAAELGVTPDAVALAAVLDQPWARIVLSGAATSAQLATNLAAGSVTLTGGHRQRLAALAEAPADYWQTRSSLGWS
jgi:aryl-alcohol dehydrogenase-like predicted oxidoreductase